MSGFAEFYQNGGLFMHAVTLAGAASLFFVGKAAMVGRRPVDGPRDDLFVPTLTLANSLLVVCLGLGLLGTLIGCLEVAAAVAEAPPDQLLAATIRGLSIASSVLTYALMFSLPTYLVALVVRYRRFIPSATPSRS